MQRVGLDLEPLVPRRGSGWFSSVLCSHYTDTGTMSHTGYPIQTPLPIDPH